MACSVNSYAGGLGEYSNGYRMGEVTKFSMKGLMMKSGEGQMLMGSESTPYITTDSDGNKTTINPWYFSVSDKVMRGKVNNAIGQYVVVGYSQSHIKNINVDTSYEITSVEGISQPRTEGCTASNYTSGIKSEGKRTGRIVKASSKGVMVDSWEIMIQQGNSGNQFKNMSISKDQTLYDCAVEFLKAGQKVVIEYDQSAVNLNVFGRNTTYDVISIQPVRGLN